MCGLLVSGGVCTFWFALINTHRHTHVATTVSYTHLDVYKRQVLKHYPEAPQIRSQCCLQNVTTTVSPIETTSAAYMGYKTGPETLP